MTNRQFALGLSIVGCVLLIAAIMASVSVARYRKEIEINAQMAVEKTRLEQDAKLARTKERMNIVPWYKSGENRK